MWWWCLVHAQVEGEIGCANQMRLGPFESEVDASQALQKAAERNAAWQEQDPLED